MRKSILAILTLVLFATAVTYGAQMSVHDPFGETFGFSSEDFGGGSYLGVDTRDVTAARLGELKLKEEHGVEVTLVDQDAPAGKAGLKEHDVILTINGSQVESVEQLRRMIREIPPGRTVELGISRDGQPMTFKTQLADRKKTFAWTPGRPFTLATPVSPVLPAMPMMPDIDVPVSIVVVHSSARSGLMVENLTPQLGDFFGAKNGQGVLVRSVEKGSRADSAGFHAGDVIVKVEGKPISDSSDFTRAVRNRKGAALAVGIIRERKEQTLTLTIPERNQSEVLDESLELPEIDVDADETVIDLSDARTKIAQVKPEIERAVREVRRIKPGLEEAARELREHQNELQREMRELEHELREQQRQLEQDLRLQKGHPEADI